MTRKDKIDRVLFSVQGLSPAQQARAWNNLRNELFKMTHPEQRPPRFHAMLTAVLKAGLRAKISLPVQEGSSLDTTCAANQQEWKSQDGQGLQPATT